jgi:hypothetical protein
LGPQLFDLVTKYWRTSFMHCVNNPQDRAVSHKMGKLCLQMCRNLLLYGIPVGKDAPAVSTRQSVCLFFSFGELISSAMPSFALQYHSMQDREFFRICQSQLSVFGDIMLSTLQKFPSGMLECVCVCVSFCVHNVRSREFLSAQQLSAVF